MDHDRLDPVGCADEMVREVVERSRRHGQLAGFKNPRLWLYATLTTCNRARVRATPPGQAPHSRMRAPGIREALALLILEDREALLLVVVEGFSYAQAASILGLSRIGVANRVARAREQLEAPIAATLPGRTRRKPGPPAYLRLVK
jgi:RNA polymerase sigma-70 factor (ECF subfamily)